MDIGSILKQEKLGQFEHSPGVLVKQNTPLFDVIRKMRDIRSGCAIVLLDGKVSGVFTERDFILKVLPDQGHLSRPVQDFMTPNPHVLTPEDSVAQAIQIINQHGHRSIPLVDSEHRFVGLISVRSIIIFLSEHFPREVCNLPPHHEFNADTPEGG
jgi:CBS domain-containing protein